jgi:hypothetical protein
MRGLRKNQKRRRRVWWKPPASAGGAGLQSSGESFHRQRLAFSPGFSEASAKAHDHSRTLSRNAEALLPLLKQRAPTRLGVWICAFFSWLDTKQKHKTKDTSTHRLDGSPAAEAEGNAAGDRSLRFQAVKKPILGSLPKTNPCAHAARISYTHMRSTTVPL